MGNINKPRKRLIIQYFVRRILPLKENNDLNNVMYRSLWFWCESFSVLFIIFFLLLISCRKGRWKEWNGMYTDVHKCSYRLYTDVHKCRNVCDEILKTFDEMGEICTFSFFGSHFLGDAWACIRDGLTTQFQDAGNAWGLNVQLAQPADLLFGFR